MTWAGKLVQSYREGVCAGYHGTFWGDPDTTTVFGWLRGCAWQLGRKTGQKHKRRLGG